jgi:hypothetical protein
MRRTIYAAALCGCLVMVAGCVSYEQHITFKSDGSGRMTLDLWLDHSLYALARERVESLGPEFAKLEGVKVKKNWTKVEGEPGNRREHTRLAVTFDKVERLNGNPFSLGNEEFSFKKKGKEFAFTHSLGLGNEQKEKTEDLSEESVELLRGLFGDCTVTYTVVMPGRVADTNGTVSKDGRTVTWEWLGYDLSTEKDMPSRMTATSRK